MTSTPRTAAVDEILAYLRRVGVADPTLDTDLSGVFDASDPLFRTPEHFVAPENQLEMINLIVWIEEHFGFMVEIDDIEVDNFRTPAVLGAYIEIRRKR